MRPRAGARHPIPHVGRRDHFRDVGGYALPAPQNRLLSFACDSPEVKQHDAHAAAVEFISGAHRNPTTL
jgi:hypothetical protein